MKRIFTLAVAVFTAIVLGSCGKEDGKNRDDADLMGTWRVTTLEYSLDGDAIGVEIPEIHEEDASVFIFKSGGECQMGSIPVQYSYSSSTHTIEFSAISTIPFSIKKLTSSEMVWSEMFPAVKTTATDEIVGEYDGKTIFKNNDYDFHSSKYYYKKGDRVIPCERIVPSTWTIFSGDDEGYYDKRLIYFERVE